MEKLLNYLKRNAHRYPISRATSGSWNTLAAVKLLRMDTDCTLADAKAAIDEWIRLEMTSEIMSRETAKCLMRSFVQREGARFTSLEREALNILIS